MPDAVKLVLAAVLAAILARALFGAPPGQPRRGAAMTLALAGCSLYLVAVAVALHGHATGGMLLVGPGVAALSVAGWLARGADDGPSGGGDPDPEPPIDWDEFDRLRDDWSRTGPRVLIPA